MMKNGVVNILAHVEFIEPDRAIVGESDVLGMDEITSDRPGP
jgi:hypothetical protein